MTEASKALVARKLRRLMPIRSLEPDMTLTNSQAAKHLGVSIKTLGRMAYPNDPDGPVPYRYSATGNLHWSRQELDAYIIRKRIRMETNLMDGQVSRSLLTDLMDF